VIKNVFFDCSELPPQERAECYRNFAECAGQWAEEATTDQLRASYLMLAQQWRELAAVTEREVNKVTVILDDPELASFLRTRDV
jgi:hypothetical protein